MHRVVGVTTPTRPVLVEQRSEGFDELIEVDKFLIGQRCWRLGSETEILAALREQCSYQRRMYPDHTTQSDDESDQCFARVPLETGLSQHLLQS